MQKITTPPQASDWNIQNPALKKYMLRPYILYENGPK